MRRRRSIRSSLLIACTAYALMTTGNGAPGQTVRRLPSPPGYNRIPFGPIDARHAPAMTVPEMQVMHAQEPHIILVQAQPAQPAQPVQPVQPVQPIQPSQPAQPTAATDTPAATGSLFQTGGFGSAGGTTSSAARASLSQPSQQAAPLTSSSVVSGNETVTRGTTDTGDLLAKSIAAPGVVIQRRNPIYNDPRIRGQHVGQIVSTADGAFWFPARQDLDTMLNKIDSNLIRDIVIIKGPYSALHGPGFSFLDIATLDTPRHKNGYETHGQTRLGFSSNGNGWDTRQTISGGSDNWGFRIGGRPLFSSDYFDGSGVRIPSSYESYSGDAAFGFDLSPDSRVEIRAMRLDQFDVEFAGLFFDINNLQTDGYSLRYILENQCYFDRLAVDVWYNQTRATGDQTRGAKQDILNLIFGGQVPGSSRSVTDFSIVSRGARFSFGWGNADSGQVVIGADFTNLHQRLMEFVRFNSATTGNFAEQILNIPPSNYWDPGLFAEAGIPLSDRVSIKCGGRIDFIRTSTGNRFINANANSNSIDPLIFSITPWDTNLEQRFDLYSAFATAEYKLTPQVTILSGVGYSERPPTLTDLYSAGAAINLLQQGMIRIEGDPHLKQERLIQYDLGFAANYDRIRGGANAFYSRIYNYITFDNRSPVIGFGGIDRQFLRSFALTTVVNTDRAELWGGEVFGEVDLGDWLTAFGLTSYVQGRDMTRMTNSRPLGTAESRKNPVFGTSEPLPMIPPLDTTVGLRLHQPCKNPKWAVEFSTRVVSDQDLVAVSLGEQPTGGFTTYDIRSYWQASEQTILTAGVENLTNKQYREHLDPRAGNQFFQPGINFYVGMQTNY